MKKRTIISLLWSITISNVFAAAIPQHVNNCIQNLDKHVSYDHLSLRRCLLNPQHASAIVDYLEEHKTIVSLDVTDNALGSEGISKLAKNNTIKYLSASQNNITDEGAIELAKNGNLKVLNLALNPVGSQGVIALANNNVLEILMLGMLNDLDRSSLQALARNDTLIGLTLYYRNIGATEVTMIANMPSLKYLGIDYDAFGDDVAVALSENPRFEAVELNNANVSDKGVNAILSMPSVKYADFSNSDFEIFSKYKNHITDQGAAAIGSNFSLVDVYLDGNKITDQAALALAGNTSLKSLSLIRNNISDEGAIALAGNTTLRLLDVSYNQIGIPGLNALAQSAITYVYTEGNPGHGGKKAKLASFSHTMKFYCMIHHDGFCKHLAQ